MAALVEALSEHAPLFAIDATQLTRGWRTHSGRGSCNQAHLATQHGRRRGSLASRRTPLVVALRAEQLLEIVVGPRQARHGVAVEQSWTVAPGHLGEMLYGQSQRSGPIAMAMHSRDQAVKTATHHDGSLTLVVAQHSGCGVHPGVGPLDIRPECRRALQTAADQSSEPRKLRRREPPFASTRSRLSATASNRTFSFKPGAASGARPSSVMALRTAAQ